MALFDTISFAGLIISASGVTPTLTVILMHANTPFMVFGSKFFFPERFYNSLQKAGVMLITAALLICISRSFLDITGYYSSSLKSGSTSLCTLVYVSAAAMQGLGALYKEKTIIEHSQPSDIHIMSCWLFSFQIIYALIFYPVLYIFQGWFFHFISSPSRSNLFYCRYIYKECQRSGKGTHWIHLLTTFGMAYIAGLEPILIVKLQHTIQPPVNAPLCSGWLPAMFSLLSLCSFASRGFCPLIAKS